MNVKELGLAEDQVIYDLDGYPMSVKSILTHGTNCIWVLAAGDYRFGIRRMPNSNGDEGSYRRVSTGRPKAVHSNCIRELLKHHTNNFNPLSVYVGILSTWKNT
jgi:hypothetical protein